MSDGVSLCHYAHVLATYSDGLVFENCQNLCAKSALPSQVVMICGSIKHSDIFEISDRLFKCFGQSDVETSSAHFVKLIMDLVINVWHVQANKTKTLNLQLKCLETASIFFLWLKCFENNGMLNQGKNIVARKPG